MADMEWYPAWRYHPTRDARIVQTADEDAALGPGWYDHPDKAEAARVPVTPRRKRTTKGCDADRE